RLRGRRRRCPSRSRRARRRRVQRGHRRGDERAGAAPSRRGGGGRGRRAAVRAGPTRRRAELRPRRLACGRRTRLAAARVARGGASANPGVADAGLTNTPANSVFALEASLTPQDLVRPWRRATIVATLIAAVELVLLVAGDR